MSLAERVVKRFGVDVAREYCQRPADGCELYVCEAGHKDCAHMKRGACLKEVARIVEQLS